VSIRCEFRAARIAKFEVSNVELPAVFPSQYAPLAVEKPFSKHIPHPTTPTVHPTFLDLATPLMTGRIMGSMRVALANDDRPRLAYMYSFTLKYNSFSVKEFHACIHGLGQIAMDAAQSLACNVHA